MKQDKKLFQKIRHTIDFGFAKGYAKHNCKKCYGKGVLEYKDVGSTDSRWE